MSATMQCTLTINNVSRFLIPFSFIVKTFYISIKLVHFLQSYTATFESIFKIFNYEPW